MRNPEDDEQAPNGDPIYRHTEPVGDLTPAPRDEQRRTANEFHLRRHLGDDYVTLSEQHSWGITLDLHVFAPSQAHPYVTVVTAGMSDVPMTMPPGYDGERLELLIGLPAGWPGLDPVGGPALQNEINYWPIRMLKELARIPHTYDSYLAWGHTIVDQDGALFHDSVDFSAALIGPPLGYPPELMRATTPVGDTQYLAVFPITPAELAYKIATPDGGNELLDHLGAGGFTAVVDPTRTDVILDSWSIHLLLTSPAAHLGEVFGSEMPNLAEALTESAETDYVMPIQGTHVRLTLFDALEDPDLTADTAARTDPALAAAVAGHRSVLTLTSAVAPGKSRGAAEEEAQEAAFAVARVISDGGRVAALWLPHQQHVCTPAELAADVAAGRVDVMFRVHPLDPEQPDRRAVTRGLRAVGQRELFRTDDKTYAECADNLRTVTRKLRESVDPIIEGRQVRYAWSRYQLADAVLPGTEEPAWQVIDQPRRRLFGKR